MNRVHRAVCRSASWRNAVERHAAPWVLEGLVLGRDVLEIGPGPGAATDLLRRQVERLTCVEIDAALAEALRQRVGSEVRVVHGDATAMTEPNDSFDAVVCFTMLHHVPTIALQDRLLREVARVLRPGGLFAGTDSLSSFGFRLLHLFDTMTIVDPAAFPSRLEAAGFGNVSVELRKPYAFRFRAWKL